jgi:hypothetical protein
LTVKGEREMEEKVKNRKGEMEKKKGRKKREKER